MSFEPVTELKVFYHRGPDKRLLVGSLLWDEHTAAFEYDASFVSVGCDRMKLVAGLPRGHETFKWTIVA